MSLIRSGATVVLGLALLAGCAESATEDATPTADGIGNVTPAAVVFDPAIALDAQLGDAISTGNVDLATAVLDAGIDLSVELPVGLPPLHYAAQVNQPEIVSILVKAGAPIEQADAQGRTPLMIAASFADAPVVQALLDAGADISAGNPTLVNRTAWQYAGQYGNTATLEVLYAAGVDINSVDDFGSSVLITAAYGGHLESVEYLLSIGVDPNLRDLANTTARGWAEYHHDTEIAEAIAAAGGES